MEKTTIKNRRAKGVNEKNIEIIRRYQNGDKNALDELIYFNYDYIYSFAERKKDIYYPLEVDDIFQDMVIGMMYALDHFDPDKSNCPFLSYATFWMHQIAYKDSADTGFLIRFPVNVRNKIKKLNNNSKQLGYLYDSEDIDNMLEKDEYYHFNRDRLECFYYMIYQMYDILNAEDCIPKDSLYFNDRIENVGVRFPYDEYVYNKEVKRNLEKVFETLTKRECLVLTLKFGLDGNDPKTYDEIGRIFSVTRERVRQIEAKAIRKLRHPYRSKYFRG